MALLALALWCGMLAGLLEVAAVVVHKRFLDTNKLLNMSRHFLWLVPLTDLLIFLLVGLAGSAALLLKRPGGRWATMRVLGGLTMLPALLVVFPQIYGLAWLLVALGISARVVPVIERHAAGFRRVAVGTAPIFALALAALAVAPWAVDRMAQAREQSHPIPAGSPNILLIVMDTVAADHLDLYGYARPTGPAIAEIAQRGSRFDAAQPTSSWTLASHASMFTGRWPHDLSVGWHTPLDDAESTVAEFLRKHGYATAGFIANTTYCAADSGLGRGFTVYRDFQFAELSPFRMAVMVRRSLEGLQVFAETVGDALDLGWLKSGVTRIVERFESDRKEAAAVNRELLDWLANRPQPERPFFAFLNYFDAHSPYQLGPRRVHRFGVKPTEEREYRLIRDWWDLDKTRVAPRDLAFALDAYDDCVASIDEQVGKLFDELDRRGILEPTWVILLSDHGESFGEHAGVYLHGSSLYQTELHVPLIVVPPAGIGVRPVVRETVSLRNIAATIADLAGLGTDSRIPGTSLARWWTPSSPPPGEAGFNEGALAELVPNETLGSPPVDPSRRPSPLAALAEEGWSYIRREGDRHEELYQLRDDPKEQNNVAASAGARPRLERMRQAVSKMTRGPLTIERFNP